MKSNLNDLKLKLASLIANGTLNIMSTSQEIQKHITATNEEIDEVLCDLLEENDILEVPEDFYETF